MCVYKYKPFTGKPLCEIELSCVGLCLHQDTTGVQTDGYTSQCENSELWIHFHRDKQDFSSLGTVDG